MKRTIFTEMGKGTFQEIDEKYVNSECTSTQPDKDRKLLVQLFTKSTYFDQIMRMKIQLDLQLFRPSILLSK